MNTEDRAAISADTAVETINAIRATMGRRAQEDDLSLEEIGGIFIAVIAHVAQAVWGDRWKEALQKVIKHGQMHHARRN